MEQKLTDLLRRNEGKTLEFKRDFSSPEKLLRTIVAFANTSGGVLLIGVDDKTRAVRGISDPLKSEEKIANLIDDLVRPKIVPDIEILSWRKTQVLAVEVYHGAGRPYFLKKRGPKNGLFVRVGSTNRRADEALAAEIKRSVSFGTFDESLCGSSGSEAIDFRAASECFKPFRKLRSSDFSTLGLVAGSGRKNAATVGGILLFGKKREKKFPDAWLQCGRFTGGNRAKILDSLEHREHLPKLPELGLEFIQKHANRALEIRGLKRKENWSVPISALREAIVNAIVHADYSQRGGPARISCFDDRIEIESPGLLPFGLSLEDLLQGVSVIRNRVIARVFKELGMVEQWGSGIHRMLSTCRANGLPDPIFEEIGFRFRVTFGLKPIRKTKFDKKEKKILDLLEKNPEGLSPAELAKGIKLTTRATRTRLSALAERGIIFALGSGPRDPNRKYLLNQREENPCL